MIKRQKPFHRRVTHLTLDQRYIPKEKEKLVKKLTITYEKYDVGKGKFIGKYSTTYTLN